MIAGCFNLHAFLNTNEVEQSFKCLLLFVFILFKIVPILCSFFYLYANISLVIYMLQGYYPFP